MVCMAGVHGWCVCLDYTIPKDTKIMCNIYGAHRHPAVWERAATFDPMRFNEASEARERGSPLWLTD